MLSPGVCAANIKTTFGCEVLGALRRFESIDDDNERRSIVRKCLAFASATIPTSRSLLPAHRPADPLEEFFTTFESNGKQLAASSSTSLVSITRSLQHFDKETIRTFKEKYDPAFGGNLNYFWRPLQPIGCDKMAAARSILDAIDALSSYSNISDRLLKSLLTEQIDIEVRSLHDLQAHEKIASRKGQTFGQTKFRSVARKLISNDTQRVKKIDRAGQRWKSLEPGVLLGIGNSDCNSRLVLPLLFQT